MGSRKKNGSKKKKNSVSSQNDLDKDFLKMDVARLRDPAYPLGGLPFHSKVVIKEAIEKKPGDLSLRKELGFVNGQIDSITPYLKSMGYLPRDSDFLAIMGGTRFPILVVMVMGKFEEADIAKEAAEADKPSYDSSNYGQTPSLKNKAHHNECHPGNTLNVS
ncbi:hypothetical protein OROHE_003251 [Orobanche hederae]